MGHSMKLSYILTMLLDLFFYSSSDLVPLLPAPTIGQSVNVISKTCTAIFLSVFIPDSLLQLAELRARADFFFQEAQNLMNIRQSSTFSSIRNIISPISSQFEWDLNQWMDI